MKHDVHDPKGSYDQIAVSMDFYYFEPKEMEEYLSSAGFECIETIVRPPYPEVEYQSQRAYIFARKPLDDQV